MKRLNFLQTAAVFQKFILIFALPAEILDEFIRALIYLVELISLQLIHAAACIAVMRECNFVENIHRNAGKYLRMQFKPASRSGHNSANSSRFGAKLRSVVIWSSCNGLAHLDSSSWPQSSLIVRNVTKYEKIPEKKRTFSGKIQFSSKNYP